MGRHSEIVPSLTRLGGIRTVALPRVDGGRYRLPIFSFCVALAIIVVTIIAPDSSASAASGAFAPSKLGEVQHLTVTGDFDSTVKRDNYTATKPKPKPAPLSAPAVGKPDPGTAQAIAYEILMSRGQGEDQYGCLVALWNRESGWNVYAANKSSGAYGIPQALPGSKMATAGADWQTNPRTQIMWGLSYIAGRYGTPCGAWTSFQSKGWY